MNSSMCGMIGVTAESMTNNQSVLNARSIRIDYDY